MNSVSLVRLFGTNSALRGSFHFDGNYKGDFSMVTSIRRKNTAIYHFARTVAPTKHCDTVCDNSETLCPRFIFRWPLPISSGPLYDWRVQYTETLHIHSATETRCVPYLTNFECFGGDDALSRPSYSFTTPCGRSRSC